MADVLNLQAVLGLDSSAFENGISAVKSGISTSFKVVGAAVAAGSAAVASFAKTAVSTGAEFDASMSQIAATMGMTTEEIENNVNGAGDTFEALRDKAKEMGSATNFSATEAAEGLNILAMSGYDATESMDMIEDVLHLAAAGSMDMASAADYVAGSMKGFNDSTKDSAYYADLMAKGATLANTSVAELGEAMSGGSASAAAYNQTAESMTVALLRLAEQGESGSAASTALAAAMKNIYTPTDQAADALEELGVAAYDESGAARDFNTVVNELNEALGDMSDAEANAYKDTIFGIQGLDAFNKMTVTSIDKQEQWADALAGATGEASKQYDTMTDNLEGDIDIFNSALDGLKIAVSDTLTGTAREFVQFGSDALSRLTEGFEEGGIDGAMDVLSDLLTEAIDMLVEKLPTFLSAGTKLITAVVQGLVTNAPSIIRAIVDIAPTIIDSFLAMLPDLVDAAAEIVEAIGNGLIDMIPELIPKVISTILTLVDKLLEHLPELIQAGIQITLAIYTGLIEALPQIIEWLPTLVQELCTALVDNLPLIIDAAISLFMAFVDAIPIVIPALIEALPQIFMAITNAILDNLPLLVQAGFELFVSLVGALPDIIMAILEAIPQIIESTIAGFKEMWPKIKETGKQLLAQVATGMVNNIKAVGNAISSLKESISSWFKDLLDKAKTWGKDMLDNFVQGIKDKIAAVKETVSNVAETIKGFLGFSEPDYGPLSNFHTYAPDMMDLFAKGITDNEDVITGAISNAFNFDDYLTGRTRTGALTGTQAGQNSAVQPIVVQSTVELGANAKGLLNVISQQNKIETKATGYNKLALARA